MTVGVDWLAFTTLSLRPSQVKQLVLSYLPGEFVDLDHGGLGYQRMAVGPGEVKAYWSPGRDDVHVEMPGRAVGALTEAQVRGLVVVVGVKGSFTRVDVYGDDHEHLVTPRGVYDAATLAVTHTDRDGWQFFENRRGGSTCYIGAAKSRQRLRVYNKTVQSGGRVDATRWELQLRHEMADVVGRRIAQQGWETVLREHLVQLVDFREREDGQRPDRCRRVSWFESLVGATGKAVVRAAQPVRTLASVRQWIQSQVAPLLAVVVAAEGGDVGYLGELAEGGRRRWRKKHHVLLAGV
jgi:hypothetical protein